MMRKGTCAFLALGLAAGCGVTGIPHCGDEELHASVAPAAAPPASPGLLALLPAKRGEPRDPGEIAKRQASYPFARLGLLAIFPIGEMGYRLAPDRVHRVGFEVYAHCEADPYGLFGGSPGFLFGAGGSALFAVGSGESFVRAGALWASILCFEAGVWKRFGRWEVGGGAYIMPEMREMPVFPYFGVYFRL